ncbi:related to tol protein [Fusarium fujikuroi]|nr:related to tol protein [Fusarium fujikuroi]
MTQSLCDPCSGFIKSFGEVEDANWSCRLEVAPNIHSLRSQARTGCHLCQIIYQSCFYSERLSWKHQDDPIAIFASPPRSYNPYKVDYNEFCKIVHDTEEEDGLPFRNLRPRQLELSINIGEKGKGRSHGLPVVGNNDIRKEGGLSFATSNPSTPHGLQRILQSAKEWLLKCRNGHVGCCNSASSDKHIQPTRLIEVGSQVEERMPRLYIPSQDARDIEYAALSYVWGGDHANFTKTTASNLDDMRRQLPWNKLSKTIQDAIIITRGLGLKYLWVDALCILQKEKINDIQHMEDWSIEAARFASYYQNAVLTIAATGSESSSRGLFLESPTLEFKPGPVVILQKSFWAGFRQSTIQPLYPDPISEIRNSALLNRAWTAQERLLSERILHFGANCIFWECSGGYVSELHPDRWDPLHKTSEFFHFKNIHTFRTKELTELWYAFVIGYSLKDISVGSDRLPALSGVATLVSTRCQQKYIAGIWESRVAEGLTWIAIRTSDIHTDGPIQSERVLPSWSWASNNGFIWFTFLHGPWESLIQVKTFHSRSKGPDTSGQVLEARLTLKGLFRMVDLSQLNTVYPYNKHAKEESTESEQQDTAKHKHIACMDGIKPAEPLGTHPRLCLLIGTIHELGYDPWRKVKKGVACVLEHSGHRYGEFEGYKRIGLVRLPFDEYWSEVKDVRTIELV